MRRVVRRRTAAVAVAVAGVLTSSYLLAAPATAAPESQAKGRISVPRTPLKLDKGAKIDLLGAPDAKKQYAVFVHLRGASAVQAGTSIRRSGGSRSEGASAARERRAEIGRTAAAVVAAGARSTGAARQLFTISNGLPGVGVIADRTAIDAMAKRKDVVKVTRLPEYHPTNAGAVQLTQVLKTWQKTGLTGKGVSIGIIDSGIDYTHADFGGPGTVEAYDEANDHDTEPGWETAKVVGGYDFVGDAYDPGADPPEPGEPDRTVPQPDPNPLDCVNGVGHGTHVAGTAAGFGVNADGTTYTAKYSALSKAKLNAMRIGPGTAPEASLYGLRVFGCEGGSTVILPAVDWALDPNGDGDFTDHLDIVNMSLGLDYDFPDNPLNTLIDQIALHGVMVVNAAGNAGDFTDAGSAARRALTVASSVDTYDLVDGLKVTAPADKVGIVPGQFSSEYDWATEPDVSGSVVTLSDDNADGCDALSPEDAAAVDGKVAWLEWDSNDATRECGSVLRSGNVAAAGAVGAVFTATLPEFFAGVSGSATIPVFQLTLSAAASLRASAQAGTLAVTFTGSTAGSVKSFEPSAADLLSDFTSRGTHGAPGSVKPDVAAPGNSIVSAGVGTGDDVNVLQGTSMASPHAAGIAALVRAKHPTWTVQQVKAAIMNTAVHDLFTKPNRKGLKYGPNRVGAGRVDASYATSTAVLAYGYSKPGAVSVTFGVVEAPITSASVKKTQKVIVRNKAFSSRKVTLSYSPIVKQPGVSYSVSPKSITIPARSRKLVTVTMTIRPKSLRRTLDPTMSDTTTLTLGATTIEGFRQFVSDASGHLLVKPTGKTALRVPVYGAAKPVSVTQGVVTTPGTLDLNGHGVRQGTGSEQFASMASLLTLGASSRRMPDCVPGRTIDCVESPSTRASDLRYVGAGFLNDGDTPADGLLWFGVSMWGNSPTPGGGRETDVAIDTNGDNVPDFYAIRIQFNDTDQPLSLLTDADFKSISAFPMNFYEGNVDTNAYDSDSFLLPVDPADIGVPKDATAFPIRYAAVTFSLGEQYSFRYVDSTDWVDFDLLNPGVSTASQLWRDLGTTSIPYVVSTPPTAAAEEGEVKGLLIHLSGRTGKRAEVVSLPAG